MSTAVAIDGEACLRLLNTTTFGRVALSVRALPPIVPVTFDVHRGQVHARAQGGVELGDAPRRAVAARRADAHDDGAGDMWNVHVVGRVSECPGPAPCHQPRHRRGRVAPALTTGRSARGGAGQRGRRVRLG